MANTYVALATTTVGSGGAANIEFTSIPGEYTDLIVKLSVRITRSGLAGYMNVTFNSNTSSYTNKYLYGDGANAASGTNAGSYFGDATGDTATASTFSNIEVYISNYSGSNYKSYSVDSVTENNATTSYPTIAAGLWSNTSAITSIKLAPFDSTNFKQYSTATLYGIKNA